jgi:hypothetical protein
VEGRREAETNEKSSVREGNERSRKEGRRSEGCT